VVTGGKNDNINKDTHQITSKGITRILRAYNTIGEFLKTFLDKKTLYKKEFLKGLDNSLNDIVKGKTKKVKKFTDFISEKPYDC